MSRKPGSGAIQVGRGSNLGGTTLEWGNLRGADLRAANLERIRWPYADLDGAQLRRANLKNAILERAILSQADLSEANLEGADLSRTWFNGNAFLRGARYNAHTRWPAGLDPAKHGAILVK
jgi:uncharacterized protein YjbI with pentapeptide repeats